MAVAVLLPAHPTIASGIASRKVGFEPTVVLDVTGGQITVLSGIQMIKVIARSGGARSIAVRRRGGARARASIIGRVGLGLGERGRAAEDQGGAHERTAAVNGPSSGAWPPCVGTSALVGSVRWCVTVQTLPSGTAHATSE